MTDSLMFAINLHHLESISIHWKLLYLTVKCGYCSKLKFALGAKKYEIELTTHN